MEHTLSEFGDGPRPVRRGLVTALKCSVRNARFFLCRQRTEMTHHYTDGTARGFRCDERKSCLFGFLFSGTIIVGLITARSMRLPDYCCQLYLPDLNAEAVHLVLPAISYCCCTGFSMHVCRYAVHTKWLKIKYFEKGSVTEISHAPYRRIKYYK